MPNMDINTEIEAIENAFEGREVRTAIVNSLEEVQRQVNMLAPAVLEYGTEVITVSDIGAQWLEKAITLPFTPTSSTKILATYRQNRSSAEDRRVDIDECLKVVYDSGAIYAIVTAESARQQLGFRTFPEGTYYVDWLVLDRGGA